jgi:hypothetical protein
MTPPPAVFAAIRRIMRTIFAFLLLVPLSGCYVTLHGHQSTSGGTTATTTSSHVTGSTKFAGGKASFSSGQPVAPKAPGGQVSLGKGASAVLILGLVIADVVHYFSARHSAREPQPQSGSIADTCSCYKKSDE